MTKADIIESVYEKVGFSKKEAAEVVEMVFDTIKETLERGEKIKISGFGNFIVRDKKSRVGRNPQTGEEIENQRPSRADLPTEPGPEERAQRGRDAGPGVRHRRVAHSGLPTPLDKLGANGFPFVVSLSNHAARVVSTRRVPPKTGGPGASFCR